MTSVLCLRKVFNGQPTVVWGADSLFTETHKKIILRNSHKYIEFPSFTVLFCGAASIQHDIEDLRLRKWKDKPPVFLQMRSRRDVHKFALEVTGSLRKRLKDLGAPEDQGHDFSLLIATSRKLYEVDFWAFVTESEEWVTGGSGGSLLTAVLLANYDQVNDIEGLKQLADKALQVACSIDLYSGGNLIVKELKHETKIQPGTADSNPVQ